MSDKKLKIEFKLTVLTPVHSFNYLSEMIDKIIESDCEIELIKSEIVKE